jgi:tight adherence protein B
VTELAVGSVAAYGTYLLYTALVLGWKGLGFGPTIERSSRPGSRVREWMAQAGLAEVRVSEFFAVVAVIGTLMAVGGWVIFGGVVPAVALLFIGATSPIASYRLRREHRRDRAHENWPRMIEEIRLRTGSLGRSVPQALFEVGARGPAELRPAFEAAHREWLLTTDFDRTLGVLKDHLADPTADVACETLLVAHQVGGADLGSRLTALAEDRIADVQGRKDARAKQAGARLARSFVILVPLGMAIVGTQIGDGRAAYGTGAGQVVVLAAISLIGVCWVWAGQIMKLPATERVFR